jgi:hypothetical protein
MQKLEHVALMHAPGVANFVNEPFYQSVPFSRAHARQPLFF